MDTHKTSRILLSGIMGGIAWILGLILFFGPAQLILGNPEFQSEKFLSVFQDIEPLPRMDTQFWVVPAGIIIIGIIYGAVYHYIRKAFSSNVWWKDGLQFGLVSWALMVPWFEFYLPWNVMHEPFLLVILEMLLWMAVLLSVGCTIAGFYRLTVEKGSFNK